jgi:hypothetical protein
MRPGTRLATIIGPGLNVFVTIGGSGIPNAFAGKLIHILVESGHTR